MNPQDLVISKTYFVNRGYLFLTKFFNTIEEALVDFENRRKHNPWLTPKYYKTEEFIVTNIE